MYSTCGINSSKNNSNTRTSSNKKRKPEYQGTPTTIGSPELTTERTPAVDHNNRLDLKKGQQ
jgi:hypothetical protein